MSLIYSNIMCCNGTSIIPNHASSGNLSFVRELVEHVLKHWPNVNPVSKSRILLNIPNIFKCPHIVIRYSFRNIIADKATLIYVGPDTDSDKKQPHR